MTMAATAEVTEPDTAAPALETPPSEVSLAAIIAADAETPETVEPDAPETAVQAEPETGPVTDPLAGLDPEVLLAHPKVREHLATETERVRRQQERATESRIQDARSSWVATGQAFQDVHAALVDGDVQKAQNLLGAALANRDWQAVNVLDRIGRSKLPEGKVASEDIDRLDQALNAAQRGTGTLDDYADTLLEVRAKAYAENVLAPQIEQRIARENAAKAKAAQKTAEIQGAEATNAAAGHPTLGVPGTAGAKVVLNTREVDSIPTQTFLGLSKDVQERLVREARDGDRLAPDRLDRSLVQTAIGR